MSALSSSVNTEIAISDTLGLQPSVYAMSGTMNGNPTTFLNFYISTGKSGYQFSTSFTDPTSMHRNPNYVSLISGPSLIASAAEVGATIKQWVDAGGHIGELERFIAHLKTKCTADETNGFREGGIFEIDLDTNVLQLFEESDPRQLPDELARKPQFTYLITNLDTRDRPFNHLHIKLLKTSEGCNNKLTSQVPVLYWGSLAQRILDQMVPRRDGEPQMPDVSVEQPGVPEETGEGDAPTS
jgi:hypothetical protein